MDDERRNMENMDDAVFYQNKTEDNMIGDSSHIDNEKENKRYKKRRLLSYFAIALIASLVGGLISSYFAPNYLFNRGESTNKGEESYIAEKTYSVDDSASISQAVKKAVNSVVGITTVKIQRYGFIEQEVDGVGSGVIINSNGYILTNSHVIGDGNAKEITVLFENGDEESGKVLWHDTALDLAIVKVDKKDLPVATLGDSDKLEVGEIAIAIGNPLGLEFQRTVTSGIISGLHRSIKVDEANIIEDLIQTDASINPGNSGGPLLNSKGEVIGINTAKIKSAEGLGFSIPINTVKSIIEQVINEGTYKTVYIGITAVEVELYERQFGIDLQADNGIIVLGVTPDSPASKAQLQIGDIITKIDGQDIEKLSQLKRAIYNYKKGDKAKLSTVFSP